MIKSSNQNFALQGAALPDYTNGPYLPSREAAAGRPAMRPLVY